MKTAKSMLQLVHNNQNQSNCQYQCHSFYYHHCCGSYHSLIVYYWNYFNCYHYSYLPHWLAVTNVDPLLSLYTFNDEDKKSNENCIPTYQWIHDIVGPKETCILVHSIHERIFLIVITIMSSPITISPCKLQEMWWTSIGYVPNSYPNMSGNMLIIRPYFMVW